MVVVCCLLVAFGLYGSCVCLFVCCLFVCCLMYVRLVV